jgi:hypothetical protein
MPDPSEALPEVARYALAADERQIIEWLEDPGVDSDEMTRRLMAPEDEADANNDQTG